MVVDDVCGIDVVVVVGGGGATLITISMSSFFSEDCFVTFALRLALNEANDGFGFLGSVTSFLGALVVARTFRI